MLNARTCGRMAGVAAVLLVPTFVFGAGFALFEHGARGVAMAGAFGATADDPTALYYNPAGIAFLDGTQAASGAYFISLASDFDGADPYPGRDYSASQKSQIFYPPHAYLTGRLSENLRWGIALNAPFGLGTWWDDDFAGRYITKRADLKVFNLNPNLAYRLSDNAALAVGLDYYVASIDLTRSIGAINPYTQKVAEVGQAHLYSDNNTGLGFNIAFLGKLGRGVSLGLGYRSRVKVYFEGNASFVQFPTGYNDFDAIVGRQIPFDRNPEVESQIEFPDEIRLALGWRNDRWGVELDLMKLGWSSFTELPITIKGYPALSSVRPEHYEDSLTYRFGVEYKKSATWAWQFGFLYDETPVPTESVSPLLPDADRIGLSIGFSKQLNERMRLDVGYLHLDFPRRSTEGKDHDNFNGTYENQAELLGFTVVYKF